MGINIDLNQIPNKKLLAISVCILSITLPPFWIIFQFNKDLFLRTELLKLLLISISSGFPVVLFSISFTAFIKSSKTADEWYITIILGSCLSNFNIYSSSVFLFQQMPPSKLMIYFGTLGTLLVPFAILMMIIKTLILALPLRKKHINTSNAPTDPKPISAVIETTTSTESIDQNQ